MRRSFRISTKAPQPKLPPVLQRIGRSISNKGEQRSFRSDAKVTQSKLPLVLQHHWRKLGYEEKQAAVQRLRSWNIFQLYNALEEAGILRRIRGALGAIQS